MEENLGGTEKLGNWIEKIGARVGKIGGKIGNQLVDGFHLLALFVICGTVVWSAAHAYIGMIEQGSAALQDILLLFIYLELGTMVGIHFKTHRLPVQFLLYVAITALTRLLIIDIKTMSDPRIAFITGAIVILTLAVLTLRIGESRFASDESA